MHILAQYTENRLPLNSRQGDFSVARGTLLAYSKFNPKDTQ